MRRQSNTWDGIRSSFPVTAYRGRDVETIVNVPTIALALKHETQSEWWPHMEYSTDMQPL